MSIEACMPVAGTWNGQMSWQVLLKTQPIARQVLSGLSRNPQSTAIHLTLVTVTFSLKSGTERMNTNAGVA